ncbi:ketoacyl-synt-domain-containing protein [Xylariaceae sp. FL0662B]|nr:ketoacyl-synt-domain-containing protein [Xylariaceae sp. FL0662B]
MADPLKLYLFGDQTYDIRPYLKDLMLHRHNPVLENFLVKAYDAIRTEIYRLPAETRDDLPRFTCLDDLVSWKQDGKSCAALDMAVTCIYQLGVFISQVDTWDFHANNSRVLGLCTGALAAAAVGCSRNTLELVPAAVDAVVVAFRTGIRVTDMAQRLQPSDSSDQSWAIIVPGLASADAVRRFCEHTILPLSARPYVSAYAPNGITVSGPPRSLDLLARSGNLHNSGLKSIQIYGPYHAPHLYSPDDVDEIVGSLTPCNIHSRPNHIPVFSSTGRTVENGSFGELLKAAVRQILLQPIRWNDILEELQVYLQREQPKTFSIAPIATKADHLIYTALKQTSLRTLLSYTPAQSQLSVAEEGSYSSPRNPKLAIIGMSGRFPGAKDNEAFWDLLYQGLDVHKPVPALHWDAKTHVDPTGTRKNTSATAFGCWLDDPAGFDARFFNISPREAPQIDPAQRLALMTAYEAIEQAGIVADATPSTRRDRVGVFYGVTSMDWMETNSAQNIDTYFIPGGNMAFIPGRINYFFKFSGPSFAINTACSSSLAGINLACNSLWRGDIDTAIAGGTNVLTNPDMTAGLDKGHFLSRTGNCKTFDDSADGYCRGEGVGTVIIKRLDDAIADRDPILGVILGAHTNHSAESESITRPHVGAQRSVFNKILNEGAVDPYTVGYVEMHGTGTQAGDAGEMSSVLDTFAPSLGQVKTGRSTAEALFVGSAKANIGHGEAASGMASLIKVLLMMQKNTIVPHCGIKTKINPKFPTDLQERNVNIALKPTPWERSPDHSKPRRAFVNNFSAAGGNTALLLEDAPFQPNPANELLDSRSHHLVAISAKNGISLQGNLKSLLEYLERNPDTHLGQLSYTTTARRMHHQHRVMLTGSRSEELCDQIKAALRDQVGMTRPKNPPKIVFTFTGQGAQYPGMGKELYDNFSLFRTEMNRLDRIGQSLGFPSMLPVIQSKEQDIGIFNPAAVQLASVCLQIALSKLWASWNITPVAVVGHSLGEYAALNVAGVLSDADTVYLVGARAALLQQKCTRDTHSMLVVKGSVDEIVNVLNNHTYEIACINSPTETVLAGINEDISVSKNLLADAGIKTTLLKVPYAFHSSQVDPVLEDFKKLACGIAYSEAKIPVLCPLDGSIVDGIGSFGPDYLARHTREPVNMRKALLTANSQHILGDQSTTLEIGPHPAISGMIKAVLGPQITSLASLQRGRPSFQILAVTLKSLYTMGSNIRWSVYHQNFKASHRVIPLPAYSWDLKQYWMQYVNDWSLRKGDPPLTTSNTLKLESTTIHRVVEERGDSEKAHIVVEADVAREDFRPLVEGHEVDGVPLCTPALYADIALSLGTYLLERYNPSQKGSTIDVSDMTILKALILRADATQQLLQAHAEADWSSNTVVIKFMTFDPQQKLQEHSRCVVRFTDRSLQQKLQKEAADVKQRIRALRDGIVSGATSRFNRPMVYRAIRPLARFHDDYRAVDEIVLNSKTLEASSRLNFGSFKKGGSFHTHPGFIDALTWSSGFAMNCNDSNDLDRDVFVNHGWGSFQLFEPMNFEKEYTTYSRMVEGADRLWHGDVMILQNERVVAYFGEFAMQGVPRRILRVILSMESGNKSKKQPLAHKQTVAPQTLPIPLVSATEYSAQVNGGPSSLPKITRALSIIAEESGLAVSDLTDGTVFGDVGIDSLLGLTISARFKEELDMDLDFNAFFYEYPTVGDLKLFLGDSKSASSAGSSTPGSSDINDDDATMERHSAAISTISSVTEEESPTPRKPDFKRALQIIAEESGVAMEDLTDDTDFADSGVDSLLSLVIVSRFQDELKLDIQHESLFLECPTVGDLKQLLLGNTATSSIAQQPAKEKPDPSPLIKIPPLVHDAEIKRIALPLTESEDTELAARKKAVDDYVKKYTAGFSVPASSSLAAVPTGDEKVVMVTGASGSLGGHLVYHIAQLPDVKMVVCLNRENKAEANARQKKAMREKGIHFPEHLQSKLLVLQTDSSKPMLGLAKIDYEKLAGSVTHLIHNAWPMSVKRPLAGFEPQFSTMRNLVDFACAVVARRPTGFRFGFQMVSSISVVGHYGRGEEKTIVPEDRVSIDAVLPNGYADAKWGCERMLDETLHKHPDRFRATTVRLGQIAGSKTSGYWNPMEHFGFMIKSSQTLNALPDVDGTVYWTPVNDIAGTLADLVLAPPREPRHPVYHIENPVGQPWREMNKVLADALGIPHLIPLEEWTQRVRAAPQRNNPAIALVDFLDSNYLRMSCGGLVMDARKTLEHSPTLAAVGPVSEEVVRKYIRVWKEIGFLN